MLKEILESRLRDVAVFVDTDDIPPASAWPDQLERELSRPMAVIALIGPDWRPTVGDDPLLYEDDWVRRELALEHKPDAVLPVVVEEAKHHLTDLPPSLVRLAARQALRLSVDRWMDDVRLIVNWVAGALRVDAQPLRGAFNFMQAVAVNAEQYNHHPDWSNTWNRVAVSLRTWDAGHVITPLDFQMAAYMNQAAARCAAMDAPSWPVVDPLGGT